MKYFVSCNQSTATIGSCIPSHPRQKFCAVISVASAPAIVLFHYCTVKLVELLAVPPGVVTEILPVTAPVGTVVVICVSELTVKVAALPANFTVAACRKLVPVRITCVPTGPLGGLKLFRAGAILKVCGEVRFPPGSSTVMIPVVEPFAGFALINALPEAVNVPAPDPNRTWVA